MTKAFDTLRDILDRTVYTGAYLEKKIEPSDSRKSFYGKAIIYSNDNYEILKSYNTEVAIYDKKQGVMYVRDWYSATTARHINAFLNRHGLGNARKNEMMDWRKYYTEKYL